MWRDYADGDFGRQDNPPAFAAPVSLVGLVEQLRRLASQATADQRLCESSREDGRAPFQGFDGCPDAQLPQEFAPSAWCQSGWFGGAATSSRARPIPTAHWTPAAKTSANPLCLPREGRIPGLSQKNSWGAASCIF